MRQDRRPRALKIGAAISLAVWIVANSVLWYHYAGTSPRERNPETGHAYALNTHGSVVYLTLTDCIILYGTLAAGAIGTFSIMLVSLRRNG
jgi:hypothetical protein